MVTFTAYTDWIRAHGWAALRYEPEIAGSIPDGNIRIFHNPSGRTVALRSAEALTKMSTMGKGGRCVCLTTLQPSYADDLVVWESQPSGTLWACSSPVQGLLYVFCNKFFLTQEITGITRVVRKMTWFGNAWLFRILPLRRWTVSDLCTKRGQVWIGRCP